MKDILVSVIMPAYNCKPYIKQAVDSVLAQEVDLELIIIDDGSNDGTDLYLEPYKKDERIHYVKNHFNQGVCKSRNQGVQMARGEYIAFLDADDWWKKEKLKKQLKYIKDMRGVFCCTERELFSEQGDSTGKIIHAEKEITYKKLLFTNTIACSSVLIKSEIAKKFPMEHEEIHEDYLTWLKILQKYKKAYGIEEPLLNSRLTQNGKSRNKWKTFHMTYGVYRYLGIGKTRAIYYMGNHVIRSALRYWK